VRTFESFKGIHRGETVIVCGCGISLTSFNEPERFITIGVNDVGRLFQPDYLVVVDPRDRFSGDRFRFVDTSQAQYLFTQHQDLGVPHPHIVRFALIQTEEPDFTNSGALHYLSLPTPSPYFALCLAVHLGAKHIGLIGVDFEDDHFFGKTGRPLLSGYLPAINSQFLRLGNKLRELGIEVFNLSAVSRINAFPRMSIEDFANRYQSMATPSRAFTTSPLRIVSYSSTPVRGVPAILARCINGATPHSGRCVWGWGRYANGAAFAGDIDWRDTPALASDVLAKADVVIVHNGKVAPEHRALLRGKPIITMAHSYISTVDQIFVRQGWPGVVVGQYQATLPEFANWTVVPLPVPLWEVEYQPDPKNDVLTISYLPSGKYDRYPPEHQLYWHAKGYTSTMEILRKLRNQFSLRLEVIEAERPHLPHDRVLGKKRGAHIDIDECVTGSYHASSLEGLATGCVVVNGVGLRPGVFDAMQWCASSLPAHSAGGEEAVRNPFTFASLEILEGVLTTLIERGLENLVAEGQANRQWMERNWGFGWQWKRFWMPVILRALELARDARG
jgi:hypothetical protein